MAAKQSTSIMAPRNAADLEMVCGVHVFREALLTKHFTNTGNPIDFPTWNDSAAQLIVDLRGGIPEHCDFCKQPFTEQRYPIPEEAGEWACSQCWKTWEQQEREQT